VIEERKRERRNASLFLLFSILAGRSWGGRPLEEKLRKKRERDPMISPFLPSLSAPVGEGRCQAEGEGKKKKKEEKKKERSMPFSLIPRNRGEGRRLCSRGKKGGGKREVEPRHRGGRGGGGRGEMAAL